MFYGRIFVCLALLGTIGSLSSCAQLKRWREGVPLETFEARNGSYFPPFIMQFFNGANYFAGKNPSLAQARSKIQLIQVKRLTPEDSANINEANLSWSADGVYLSYETVDTTSRRIQVKNIRGDYSKDLLMLPRGRSDFLKGFVHRAIHSYNAGLSWSRDSTRFAFMSNGGVGEYNIYVGAVGVNERAIARSPSKDGFAAWSPNSDEIAFVSARSGNGDIYLVRVGDRSVFRLTSSQAVDIFPTWFPDGQKLIYASGDALNHDIVVAEKNAKRWDRMYKLTNWEQDDLRPTISPDGQLIAFYSTSPQAASGLRRLWNIHVVKFVPGKTYSASELRETVVAHDIVVDLNTGPAWTPDSRKIFYVKHEPDRFNPIYGYDLYSGRSYRLETKTRMNRDILMSSLGVLSFRAQVGAWDRVFLALTNQGNQLQKFNHYSSRIHYAPL